MGDRQIMSRLVRKHSVAGERAGGTSAAWPSQLSPKSQVSRPSPGSQPSRGESWQHVTQGWSAEDWDDFEERAAIIEYDGGKPRELAEALAAAIVENRRLSLDK